MSIKIRFGFAALFSHSLGAAMRYETARTFDQDEVIRVAYASLRMCPLYCTLGTLSTPGKLQTSTGSTLWMVSVDWSFKFN